MNIILFLEEFGSYLKNPVEVYKDKNIKIKFTILIYCFLLLFTITFFVSIMSKLFLMIFDPDLAKLIEASRQSKLFLDSPVYNIYYILLLGPLVEELIFRLPLVFSKINILLAGNCLILLLVGGKFSNLFTLDLNMLCKLASIILFTFICINYFTQLRTIIIKFYKYYFYSIVIAFALIHTQNYSEIPIEDTFLIPLLIIPQVLMGIFFGYIRVKNGFLWAVGLHSLINFPAVLIYILK
jgi:hypothetical protein